MPVQDLPSVARELRRIVIEMARFAAATHLAGPLSSADLFAVLYFGEILSPDQDQVILSCGHYAPILYACLIKKGEIGKDAASQLGRLGGLPVHPERIEGVERIGGVVASTGPLAQGMSVAVGIAVANKRKSKKAKIYCVCSDGELQEGQAWEAVALAVREKLGNLVWLIDVNNIQIGRFVNELAGETPLSQKLEAFGCNVLIVDGHDPEKIQEVLQQVRNNSGVPTAVVLRTTGGKGVTLMENNPKWHDGRLTQDHYEQAIKELEI